MHQQEERDRHAETQGALLLETARSLADSGNVDSAWQTSMMAARIGRAQGDAQLIAEAATIVTEPDVMSWRSVPARQALCFEALGMLGPPLADEPRETAMLRARVRRHLDSLPSGWAEPVTPLQMPPSAATPERFAALTVEHERQLGPGHTADWIEQGARAIELGRIAGNAGMVARGRLWRLDAFLQLGLRLESQHELVELAAAVRFTGSAVWEWRLGLIHANIALLEDRPDDAAAAADAAAAIGRDAGSADSEFLDLVLRAEIASRTGAGLDTIEADVRAAIADAPIFAQGWRAGLLLRLGRRDEALGIWRLLAPQIDALPRETNEWLVATAGHAALAIDSGDLSAARQIRRMLRPFAHQHIAAPATTPYGGPVALVLARLDRALGEPLRASTRAAEALTRSEAMGAPWHADLSRDLLLGTAPKLDGLSARESEVADLVAAAKTNREIAQALYLSERTVEQHVRSILHKLDLPNRAAIAAWVTRRRR